MAHIPWPLSQSNPWNICFQSKCEVFCRLPNVIKGPAVGYGCLINWKFSVRFLRFPKALCIVQIEKNCLKLKLLRKETLLYLFWSCVCFLRQRVLPHVNSKIRKQTHFFEIPHLWFSGCGKQSQRMERGLFKLRLFLPPLLTLTPTRSIPPGVQCTF